MFTIIQIGAPILYFFLQITSVFIKNKNISCQKNWLWCIGIMMQNGCKNMKQWDFYRWMFFQHKVFVSRQASFDHSGKHFDSFDQITCDCMFRLKTGNMKPGVYMMIQYEFNTFKVR